MNPDEPVKITVDIPFLKKYFGPMGFSHKKENHIISKKEYDQVKDFLSKYNIQDQQTINNFCFLIEIFRGQSTWANEPGPNIEEESRKTYHLALSKFGKFLEENTIKAIHLEGESKVTGAREPDSISLNDPKFIKEAIKGFSSLINDYKFCKERGILDFYKQRPGAAVKLPGIMIREHFFTLLKFLNNLLFPELKDFSETEENYFAGKLFLIAGIIKPKPYTTAYKNKTERYYLVKTMQNLRKPIV